MIENAELKEVQTLLKKIEGNWDQVAGLPGKLDALQKAHDTDHAEGAKLITAVGELRTALDGFRRGQLLAKQNDYSWVRTNGRVTDECAAHIGAMVVLGADQAGKLAKAGLTQGVREALVAQACRHLGIETKAAITTADMPLPQQYVAQVAELVSLFGTARKYGTVFPLATGTVNLPKLTTDTTFGLIAMSGTVTEKSPQYAFVTFLARKWGGLIHLPSEIDVDSIVAIGQFIARYAARNIARAEDALFWVGDGTATYDTLKGLTYSVIDDACVTQLGGGKTSYDTATLADFRAIRAQVAERTLLEGAYYMHTSMEALLASFNTAAVKYFEWRGPEGGMLDGFPVRWVNVMPSYSTAPNVSKVFALFGDPSWQYLGVRSGPQLDTSREVFFATDELAVRALERFTIGKMATNCVSGLETAAA